MTSRREPVFVGLKGAVVAVDRESGQTRWRTDLKDTDFVTVLLHDGDLFAASRGPLYRIDPSTGAIRWCNELPGLGYGIVSIAGAAQVASAAEKKRLDDEAAAAAAG